MNIEEHLIEFAKDQIRTLGDESGRGYVRRCICHWHGVYGEAVASRIAEAVNLDRKPKGKARQCTLTR